MLRPPTAAFRLKRLVEAVLLERERHERRHQAEWGYLSTAVVSSKRSDFNMFDFQRFKQRLRSFLS
jgi:hypothetical protein